jgi:hypothetical protein
MAIMYFGFACKKKGKSVSNLPIPFWNRFSRIFRIPWGPECLGSVEMNRSPHLPDTCPMYTLDNLWHGNKTYSALSGQ